jgi:hypothetical protein
MSFQSSRNRLGLIVVFITLLIVCEATAYAINLPQPRQPFFQFYVLGANHTAGGYYPMNDSNIYLREPITWYIGVVNNMGTVQLVSIRVKTSNQTIPPPDDQLGLESPAPTVTDFAQFLQDNETWEVPFVWSISNATSSSGATRILTVEINNQSYPATSWSASNGYNFRIIFELWTWQTDSNTFEYGWVTQETHSTAWLQVWFNMTSLSPH